MAVQIRDRTQALSSFRCTEMHMSFSGIVFEWSSSWGLWLLAYVSVVCFSQLHPPYTIKKTNLKSPKSSKKLGEKADSLYLAHVVWVSTQLHTSSRLKILFCFQMVWVMWLREKSAVSPTGYCEQSAVMEGLRQWLFCWPWPDGCHIPRLHHSGRVNKKC